MDQRSLIQSLDNVNLYKFLDITLGGQILAH